MWKSNFQGNCYIQYLNEFSNCLDFSLSELCLNRLYSLTSDFTETWNEICNTCFKIQDADV